GSSGTLYTGTTNGQVVAVDSSNGSTVAVYEATESVWTAPSIRPDNTLVVADRMGNILVLGGS
ncbi:MAG TPA: hypothetical protein VFG86_19015, partial [Chloroflexota bacterium]|nr:hypothetical protein [Chloroflexota bacterium]